MTAMVRMFLLFDPSSGRQHHEEYHKEQFRHGSNKEIPFPSRAVALS